MYRQRIAETRTRSPAAKRLQQALLAYHDFRTQAPSAEVCLLETQLAAWQSQRLIHTHQRIYRDPAYHEGLRFLFEDLYSHQDFSERDRDLERIFPKLVKLLPAKILETVALLVQLNLLTQQLDRAMAHWLVTHGTGNGSSFDAAMYCEAFRQATQQQARQEQLQLVQAAGIHLDRYAHSQTIAFGLRVTEGAADMAGLGALHGFICRGFAAFRGMHEVPQLMHTIVDREQGLLNTIFQGHLPDTFLSFAAETHHD